MYEYFDEIRNEHRQPQSKNFKYKINLVFFPYRKKTINIIIYRSLVGPRIFYPIRIQIIAGTEKGDLILINNVSGKHEDTCPVRIQVINTLLIDVEFMYKQ